MRNIVIVDYQPQWPEMFAEESAHLREALGATLVAVHHVGSTSVPGLAAKPIIDILAVVRALAEIDGRNRAMRDLGYEPKGELGIPGRRFFSRGPDDQRTHHLHAYELQHAEVAAHLDFSDYLRAHLEPARRYAQVKAELAQRHRHDIEAYIEGKEPLIHEILDSARQWRGSPGDGA
ncbi:MAG: GrpB family protein [Phycisphaerae bacterium]|nr:GrpB family protein [Phycisphaerae bacterium]